MLQADHVCNGSGTSFSAPPSHVRSYPDFRHDGATRQVMRVPITDKVHRNEIMLLNHLVSAAQQRERECDAKGLGALHVEDQLNLGHLLDRKVRWLFSLENPTRV